MLTWVNLNQKQLNETMGDFNAKAFKKIKFKLKNLPNHYFYTKNKTTIKICSNVYRKLFSRYL